MELHRDAGRDPPTAQGNGCFRGVVGAWAQAVAIPNHQLLRRIGRGSYGEVWLARSRHGSYRAVKIVHREAFERRGPFERELSGLSSYEPISRSHEGLIEILDIGVNEHQGYFYCVMELGDDQNSGQTIDPGQYSPKTLAKEIALHGRLPFEPCLQLGLALSLALVQLHKHGLVHRDVKPSNIIFVNGVPKLADIGLVAEVDEARSYVGTVGFIPPEGPGTSQADIYSLGKVLYEASTGKDRHDFPELPTRLDKFSDHDLFLELNEVIVRACRNDVQERYASAWDMYADLLMLANGESIKRLNSRDKRMAGLKKLVPASSLLIAALAVVVHQVYHGRDNAFESSEHQAGAFTAYGNRAMESGDLLGALPYFTGALQLDRANPGRELRHRLRLGSTLSQCAKLEQLWFLPKEIADVGFSPNGEQVLLTEQGGRARAFSIATGRPLGCNIDQDQLHGAQYSPDGKQVVTASGDRTACVWNVSDGSRVLRLEHPDQVYSARFSPDGSRIITACGDHQARIWDAHAGRLHLVLADHTDAVLFATFSHNGRLIVTASRDKTARIWDAIDGRTLGPVLPHPDWVSGAAFSPDDQRIVTGCADYKARVWEVPSGRRIPPELDRRDGIISAEFSPDGRWILTASLAGTARLWHADNLLPLSCNPVLSRSVTHACFGPDGRRILTTCADGTARIWNLAGSSLRPVPAPWIPSEYGSKLLTRTGNSVSVWDSVSTQHVCAVHMDCSLIKAQLNRNGRFLLSICQTQSNLRETNYLMQVWDTKTGEPAGPGMRLANRFLGASLSDGGGRLVTFSGNLVRSWDVRAGAAPRPPLAFPGAVSLAIVNPDGTRLLVACGNRVHVRDAISGEAVFRPLDHPAPVVHAEFSRDGSRLVTCCASGELTPCSAQVWDARSGQPVGPPLRHNDGVLFATFSPDGRQVVTASEDFTAIVWDTATGRPLTRPLQHEHQVKTARFSPDGKWIVTASQDKTARIWSAETGDPLTPPLRHITRVRSARFLVDGRRILTSGPQGRTWIWQLPLDERPIEDLRSLSRLLSGRDMFLAGQRAEPHSESLPGLWQQLRIKYPGSFTVSTKEIQAWHESQAQESEAEEQWYAAGFHWERLLALRPGDATILARLNQARKNAPHERKAEVVHAEDDD